MTAGVGYAESCGCCFGVSRGQRDVGLGQECWVEVRIGIRDTKTATRGIVHLTYASSGCMNTRERFIGAEFWSRGAAGGFWVLA